MMMRRDGFYVIRCPNCGRYTYAPIRQKTRLCVYCQRIFKINPLNAVYVENAETARTYVKQYQSGKHHLEFMHAVEKSRDTIRQLIPDDQIKLDQLQEHQHPPQSVSNRRRELERILNQHARTSEMDLQVLEQECDTAGIPWDWASHQIEMLIASGHIISPKPWQIRLVVDEATSTKDSEIGDSSTKLIREIGEIVRQSQEPLSFAEILAQFKRKFKREVDIEEALDILRHQGYVLKTPKGTYKWIAK